MPFLPEVHSSHRRPDLASSTSIKLFASPVKGPDHQTKRTARQSFLEGVKRFFKGQSEAKIRYPDTIVRNSPRNANQPSDTSDQRVRHSNTKSAYPNLEPSLEGGEESTDGPAEPGEEGHPDSVEITGDGAFAHASNFVIHRAILKDQSQAPVLKILFDKMTKGANVDSSARFPLPKCHPGTRTRLTTDIQAWLLDRDRDWRFLWLSGPAGVGKSAVAQTVSEYAARMGVLGAAYFFSRSNRRNKYAEVFITLAYQLSIRFPGYQPLLAARLSADPELLDKLPSVQFRKLIVEPLSLLPDTRKHVIILDGLDECDNEDSQLEIIELINNLLHSAVSLPIIWMICSRQEVHLKRIFAQTDYTIQCWKEFLPIDSEESRSDTDIFIRGRFREIHKRYGEYVEEDADGLWPPEAAIEEIVEKSSGLFVLADTLLKYIEDPKTHEPDQRLGGSIAIEVEGTVIQ